MYDVYWFMYSHVGFTRVQPVHQLDDDGFACYQHFVVTAHFSPLLPVLDIDHFSKAVICGTAAEATTRLAEETRTIFSWNTLFVHVELVLAPSFLDGLLKRTWQWYDKPAGFHSDCSRNPSGRWAYGSVGWYFLLAQVIATGTM